MKFICKGLVGDEGKRKKEKGERKKY